MSETNSGGIRRRGISTKDPGHTRSDLAKRRRQGDSTELNQVKRGHVTKSVKLSPLLGDWGTPYILRRVQDGMTIGNIRVRKVEIVPSEWGARVGEPMADGIANFTTNMKGEKIPVPRFDENGLVMHRQSPRYDHMTGLVECTCLLCGNHFGTNVQKLCPNNINRSLYSCGCQKRPEKRTKPRSGGPKPTVIEPEMEFARLRTIEWVPKQGWLCKCICGKTLVVNARSLKHQSIRGCKFCDPVGWSPKRGPRKKLTEIDGKPIEYFKDLLWWQREE